MKEKEGLASMNYKIANIENYLQSIDKDMDTLAQEAEVPLHQTSSGNQKNKSGNNYLLKTSKLCTPNSQLPSEPFSRNWPKDTKPQHNTFRKSTKNWKT